MNLTARTIETVKPVPGKRVDYFDDDVSGLALRVSEQGCKTWTLFYRIEGRQRRYTIARYPDLGLKEARKAARHALNHVANGEDPAEAKIAARHGETFADLAKEYLEKHAKKTKRTWRHDEWLIQSKLKRWNPRKVADLTRRDVRELVEGIAEAAPVMANRTLALIRKMLNFAVERDWIDVNPAWKLTKPGKEHTRDRVLTDSEIRDVWKGAAGERPALCALVRLELLTAQRSGELARMRWTDVDFKAGWWTLPGEFTKNGKAHRVPLAPAAVTMLKALQKQVPTDAWVFAGRSGLRPLTDAKKAAPRIIGRVVAARAKAGKRNEPFHFRGHDLRRTAASYMAAGGMPRFTIARVLNHVESGVTAIYDRHSYDLEKRAALDWWTAKLQAILANKRSTVLPFAKGA